MRQPIAWHVRRTVYVVRQSELALMPDRCWPVGQWWGCRWPHYKRTVAWLCMRLRPVSSVVKRPLFRSMKITRKITRNGVTGVAGVTFVAPPPRRGDPESTDLGHVTASARFADASVSHSHLCFCGPSNDPDAQPPMPTSRRRPPAFTGRRHKACPSTPIVPRHAQHVFGTTRRTRPC